MDDLLPTVIKYRLDDTIVEVCHGKIPDVCRLLYFDPVTEFELPDAIGSQDSFELFLDLYREAKEEWFEGDLLWLSQRH